MVSSRLHNSWPTRWLFMAAFYNAGHAISQRKHLMWCLVNSRIIESSQSAVTHINGRSLPQQILCCSLAQLKS